MIDILSNICFAVGIVFWFWGTWPLLEIDLFYSSYMPYQYQTR